jgi:CRISPR/Cas system-associated endoribonuclease Cas2
MISPIPASGRRSPTCAWINRIQYSAFAGWLSRNHQEELMKQAVRCLGRQAGRIYLYCIAEREWRLRLEYGRSDAAPRGDAAPGGDIR